MEEISSKRLKTETEEDEGEEEDEEGQLEGERYSPSDDSDRKSTVCYSPLNLKVSPNQCYQDDDLKEVKSSYGVTDSIRVHLEGIFLTPESNLIALEEKARSLLHFYGSLNSSEKALLLRMLSTSFGVEHQLVERLAAQVSSLATSQASQSDGRLMRIEDRLRSALVPRYQQLFTLLSRLENGVRFLLQIRSDIITIISSPGIDQDSPHFHSMNSILHNLLSIWMSVGSLSLEKITWESPCDLLQKICTYEAVQCIRTWTDLKQRVGPYRRCFAFTHITLPREPVIVIHAAITSQISWNVQSIIGNLHGDGPTNNDPSTDENSGEEKLSTMTTAVFYSITSTQKGLQGIEFGNNLIQKIIVKLQVEFPRIHQFSSLSPIPGFRDWLLDELNVHVHLNDVGERPDQPFISDRETSDLAVALGSSETSVLSTLREVLLTNKWLERPNWFPVLKDVVLKQCARYLYVRKKRGYVSNTVANFHLRNGAVLWRINWLADTSSRGVAASLGLMANYRYYPEQMALNSKNYIERRIVAVSDQVLELVQEVLPDISTPKQCR